MLLVVIVNSLTSFQLLNNKFILILDGSIMQIASQVFQSYLNQYFRRLPLRKLMRSPFDQNDIGIELIESNKLHFTPDADT